MTESVPTRLPPLLMLAGVLAGAAGCATTRKDARAEPNALVPTASSALSTPLSQTERDALARSFLDGSPDPLLAHTLRGQGIDWFAAVLNVAMRESRDISASVSTAATLAVHSGQERAGCRAVEEVVNRVCCLRSSFVAAALDGIVRAYQDKPLTRCPDAAMAGHLETLRRDPDQEVAAAASRLLSAIVNPG